MLIVIGKMAYVRDFISSMTVMTLMTVTYELILDARFVFHPRGLSSITYQSDRLAPGSGLRFQL
jgi:hypothetical protein